MERPAITPEREAEIVNEVRQEMRILIQHENPGIDTRKDKWKG